MHAELAGRAAPRRRTRGTHKNPATRHAAGDAAPPTAPDLIRARISALAICAHGAPPSVSDSPGAAGGAGAVLDPVAFLGATTDPDSRQMLGGAKAWRSHHLRRQVATWRSMDLACVGMVHAPGEQADSW